MHRVLLSVVLISCMSIFSCKQKQPPPVPPTPVNLFTVKKQTALYYDKYPSTTQALSQVNLLPQVQGYITGIYFIEGALVKKGQKLYEIDKRLYQAAVDAAEANVKVAEGNQVQAQQDADRYVYLNNYHAVAKQQYDHAVIALENAKSQVKAAEEAVKTAKTNLAYSTIYAPFDGTIGFSQVKLGNMVVVGQTVLNTISTNNPMAVDFLINEKQLMDFEKIEKGKGKPIDSLFTLLLPNNSLYPQTGKISIIDRAVDPQTGSIRVRLVFPNPENDLKVGMSCIVRVHNQDAAPQLVVPGKAIVEQMGEYFVFVVKDTIISHRDSTKKEEPDTAAQQGPRPYAFQKKVKLGQTIGANVIIKDGISEGDRIVIDGIQSLHEGSQVNVGNKKPEGSGSDSTRKMDSSKIK
ncbi:MAG TPA: efflux RND transporter periplasmic adaptor subunit [Puia sp.]|nr:efflux RND transporter periplasmic adaptor subunit [Puia sp.]